MFQNMLEIIFESIPMQKTVSEVPKTWYFSILHFGLQANEGEGATAPLSTLLPTAELKRTITF